MGFDINQSVITDNSSTIAVHILHEIIKQNILLPVGNIINDSNNDNVVNTNEPINNLNSIPTCWTAILKSTNANEAVDFFTNIVTNSVKKKNTRYLNKIMFLIIERIKLKIE